MKLPSQVAKRSELWVPAAVTLVLCARDLSARALWFDEHASWWAASMPFSVQRRLFAHLDLAIAPYYLLLKAWISLFGDSPALLRLPSLIAMSASAALVGQLGKTLIGVRAGLAAGLIFAAAPAVTRYGQEARVYAFVVLLALSATLLLLRALEGAVSTRRWAAYAGSLIALGLAHPPALCLIAAHASALIDELDLRSFRLRLRAAMPWFGAVLAASFVLAPMLWFASAQSAQIAWNIVDDRDLIRYPSELFRSRRLALAVLALSGFALLRPTRARVLLACWALIPPALFFVTRDALHLFLPRYLLFTLPAWVVLAAAGLEALARRTRHERGVLALGSVALVLLGLTAGTRERFLRSIFDHRAAAASIRAAREPGDAIAFGGDFKSIRHGRIALRYELRDDPPRDIFAAASMLEKADFIADDCPLSVACLPADVERIWLVTSGNLDDPWAGLAAERIETLTSQFEVSVHRAHTRANVFLLVRKL